MSRYMISVRYTAEGAAGVAKAGLASRREVMRETLEAQGGRLVEYWASGAPEWDVVFVAELDQPRSALAANSLFTRASGTLDALHVQELYDCEEVDAHLQRGMQGWRPAGQ